MATENCDDTTRTHAIKAGTHRPNHWMSEANIVRCVQLCQKLSEPRRRCRLRLNMDSLIGGVLANQRSVWEGRNIVCAEF